MADAATRDNILHMGKIDLAKPITRCTTAFLI